MECLSAPESQSTAERWRQTLDRVIPGIVVIRVCISRAFDGGGAGFCVATGFVVDKARGIILTNRHVVSPGPVRADAIFHNKEEVELLPYYRDPVHDFGFFRFNPGALKFMDLVEIPLVPAAAKVGVDLRVVGNDAGEKLSILSGTLARLDRDAPNYGSSTYSDFNTFYYSAASSTSGGSSGSPVLNVAGEAIALNAGGARKAASSYYLPLDRVVRALSRLQEHFGESAAITTPDACVGSSNASDPCTAVPRGTLQTVFQHKAFDEVRRLGVTTGVEEQVRRQQQDETGMLVVEQVVPGGAADGQLRPGDVLLTIDTAQTPDGDDGSSGGGDGDSAAAGSSSLATAELGPICTSFIQLEEVLDNTMGCGDGGAGGSDDGATVCVRVLRGGALVVLIMRVDDLHAISPSELLEVSGTVLHPLSYHQARCHNVPVGGVFMAQSGHMLSRAGMAHLCVLTGVGSISTPDLNSFERAFAALPDRSRTVLKYFVLRDRHRIRTAYVTVDRTWFPMQRVKRGPDGIWRATPSPAPPPRPPQAPPVRASPIVVEGAPIATQVFKALVLVTFDIPYMVDGITMPSYIGAGIVVDAERGLVLVDRSTVPIALGDAMVTVAASAELQANVVFVHPVHNFAVVRFNPADLGDAAADVLHSAQLNTEPLAVGEALEFVGITQVFSMVSQQAVITKIDRLALRETMPPMWRATNVEVLSLDRVTKNVGGVFVDGEGRVRAAWQAFSYVDDGQTKEVFRGLPVTLVAETVRALRAGEEPALQSLAMDLQPVTLAKARACARLPQQWCEQLERTQGSKRQVLSVKRCTAGSDAAKKLRNGDMLLEVGGQVAYTFRDVEQASFDKPRVELTVIRDEQELKVEIDTLALSSVGTDRIVQWSGMLLQPPHQAVLQLGYVPEGGGGGVYVSRWSYGSPAHKYGLRATVWLTEINGTPTPDLDAFLAVVTQLEDNAPVRLMTVDLTGKSSAHTLKTDHHYWPTLQLRYMGGTWQLVDV